MARGQPPPRSPGPFGDGPDALGVLRDGAPVNGHQQVFLGVDVMVQAGFAQTHAVGDVLHGRGVVAFLAEELERALQQFFIATGGAVLRQQKALPKRFAGHRPNER